MALTSEFDILLKEYAPNDLLLNEIQRLNWLLPKLNKDTQWPLGEYQIPVETAEYSRFEWGSLPAETDIPGAAYLKPAVSKPKQLLGSMLFTQQDLMRHTGDMKKSFLQILPNKVKQFTTRMSELINLSILNDGSLADLTADGTALGVVTVGKSRIGYFTNKQKVELKGTGAAVLTVGYVRNININAGTFVLYDAAEGGAVVDVSLQTTALASKVWAINASAGLETVTNLVDIIFSAANGGADTLYDGAMVKSAAAAFQPYFNDITSATTGANLMAGLYTSYFEMIEMGRSSLKREIVLPFHAFRALATYLEGNRKYQYEDVEAVYGSRAIKVTGPDGDMVIRAARGMPTTKGFFLDYEALTVASRGELIKKANPMSKEDAFEIRKTTGYQYIVDKMAEFELIVTNPQALGGVAIAATIT